MQVLTLQGPRFKTKPLRLHQAKAWKSFLEKNSSHKHDNLSAEIFENNKIKAENPARWIVFWTPKPAIQEKIRRNQERLRRERAKEELSSYEISNLEFPEGYSGIKNLAKKQTYVLNLEKNSCACEDFQFTCQFNDIKCKHLFIYKLLKGEKI